MRYRLLAGVLVACSAACTDMTQLPTDPVAELRPISRSAGLFIPTSSQISETVLSSYDYFGHGLSSTHASAWAVGSYSAYLTWPVIYQGFFGRTSYPASSTYYSWHGDTLWRLTFDRLDYGNNTSGGACPAWSSTSYQPATYTRAIGSGGTTCNANWNQSYYNLAIERIEQPFVTSLSGPSGELMPGSHTWTASASGGNEVFTYQWHKSDNGGQWNAVCGTTAQCTLSLSGTAPPFALRVAISTTENCTNYGSCSNPIQTQIRSASIAGFQAFIDGPSTVRTNWICTWSGSADGIAPFTYQWSGVRTGTGSSTTGKVPSSGNLVLTVTDATGRVATRSHYVTLSAGAEGCDW